MKQEKISKKIENQILKKDWEFSSDRRMGYHLMYCFHFCFIDYFPKIFGVDQMSSIYTVEDGVTSFFYIKKEYDVLIEKMRYKLQTDKKFVKLLTRFIYDRYSMYEKYANSHSLAKTKLNHKDVLRSLKKIKSIEEKMSAPFWIIFNPQKFPVS